MKTRIKVVESNNDIIALPQCKGYRPDKFNDAVFDGDFTFLRLGGIVGMLIFFIVFFPVKSLVYFIRCLSWHNISNKNKEINAYLKDKNFNKADIEKFKMIFTQRQIDKYLKYTSIKDTINETKPKVTYIKYP